MARFILSAFADEIHENFDIQLESLKKLGIEMIELRGVDGKSFVNLTDDEVAAVSEKLKRSGIKISALGTPIGKIDTDGNFEAHKKLLSRIMDIGDALGCKRLRVFSFYAASGESDEEFKAHSFAMLGELLDMAEKRGFILCHENEKDIYGCSPERELELLKHFGGRLKAVLDPGNFAFCLFDASKGYPMLKDYIEYLHIKDADETGAIVPPGKGVAHIYETLASIYSDRPDSDIMITVEPHLMVFSGLSGLSKKDNIRRVYTFESPFEAFKTAADATKEMVARITKA